MVLHGREEQALKAFVTVLADSVTVLSTSVAVLSPGSQRRRARLRREGAPESVFDCSECPTNDCSESFSDCSEPSSSSLLLSSLEVRDKNVCGS